MRAIQYTEVGEAAYVEVPLPQPKDQEVRLRPLFTGICGTDSLVIAGKHSRALPPVILGHEFSAIALESDPMGRFSSGDLVAIEPLISCETCNECTSGRYNRCTQMRLFGIDIDGSLAEEICVPTKRVHKVPNGTAPEVAALVEPLAVAHHLVNFSGTIPSDTEIFIFGGGPIGILAALILKANGCKVAISELNPDRQAIARQLGFAVVEPEANLQDELCMATGVEHASHAYEATGTSIGLQTCIRAIAPGGLIGCVGLPKETPSADITTLIAREASIYGSRVYTSDDFKAAIELIGSGKLDLSAFTSTIISFDDALTDGFSKLKSGTPELKILIKSHSESS